MRQLKEILDDDEDTLLLELALLNDSGKPIASFCNRFEGDGYLAPYVYDEWSALSEHMTHVLDDFINATVIKAKPVAQKLQSDTFVRLRNSLQTFRACRLLGY